MVELHAYRHPKATRKNLPTDHTERFMEPEDYEEQSLTPDRIDNTNHPVLQWNRTEREEFEHGPLYTHENGHFPMDFIRRLPQLEVEIGAGIPQILVAGVHP